MNKNRKTALIIPCSILALAGIGYAGYEFGKNTNSTTSSLVQSKQSKHIAYADKVSDIVVTEITEDGYVTLHGDHSHYEKGLVPYNAKFLDKLVYNDKNYKLKDEDIQYEVAQGYIIKVNGKYYYYPKEGVKQSNIVDEKTAREMTAHSHHHHHSGDEKEDNYTFNPKDIVSETADGYVVRHGDHFHYIKKSDLTSQQLTQAKKYGRNTVLTSSTAGITTPTNDGYIFKGERDIIGRNNLGFIVRHGNHQHFIPYSQLRGTKWEYLLSSPSTPSYSHNSTPSVPSTEDNYTFDPKDIVSEDENGYIVKHGDHYHYIPKKNNHSNNNTQTPDKPKPNTPSQDDKKDFNGILKFPGIHSTASDGFLLSENDKVTTTSSGILVKHGSHEHFIYYYQLVNSKFENLIPNEYKDRAKDEYKKLEQEVTKKINYLARKNNADAKEFHFVVTNEGNAIEFKGKTTLLKDIVIDNTDNTKPNDTDEDKSLQEKINYLAKSLNIDPSTIKVIDTDKGKALVYPHGDHTHTILAKDIDTSKPIEDPHHNAGADTLKKLGFDDDIIHDIQHASADTDFPTHETDTEKMKEWLKTVKYLNIGQNKDPLKRKGIDLMPNIEVLGVGFTPIDDITPIYKFKKLKQLYVSRTGIKDYSFIKNIPTLEGIDFSENDVQDISFLKDYPNLKLVAAAGNNIKNIDVLKNLKNLESLNLDNNKISDISALKDLAHLKAVSLENNNITKLDALNNKSELSRLFLSNNSGLELATLKNNNLEQLTVNNCNIRDLSVVSNLPKLKNLVANDNKISTLSHLKNAKSLDSVEVNNNNIDRLDFENNTITSLEIKNNKLDNINNIHKLTSLENLDASDNEISELPTNKHNKLVNLTLSNNKITTLENVNNLTALKYLTIPNNYVSTLVLKEKNKILEYLDISHNNISKEELTVPSGEKIPKGIADNFEKVDGGDVKDNYTLSTDYITNEAKKLQEEILKLKNEKKLNSKVADELKQKARLIDLDITYSVDKSKNKLISLEKQLNEIRKDIKEHLANNNQTSHNDDNQGNQNSHHDENGEHKFEFDVNNIVREEGNGYIVKHGDHNHFVKKSDLTAEQLEQAKKFLENKENSSTTTDKETLTKKKNYIALFYGIKETDIKVENNTLVFTYKGTVKRLVLSGITVPPMSNDLEADFEKEITALATSMNTTVEHIQVQDGQMIVNHGDHNHYYPIKSPGWRLYNQNKIPYIEIPKVNGTIDEAVVNNKITELENKAKVVLAKNPAKLRKILAWLNNFREVSLAWHLTATDGYLQALANFEKTQLNS